MTATVLEITGRMSERPSLRRDVGADFRFGARWQRPAEEILTNPQVSLYGLDFEKRQAAFVETPADVDLSQAAFYFSTQYESAARVLIIPFEAMIQLAQSTAVDGRRLIFIHSTGRCGSTLASQIFAQVPGVINISEPYALSQLVMARNTRKAAEDELVPLLAAVIRLLCKQAAGTAWVVKGQSFVIELGEWLHRLYPGSRHLFLYRQAESWLLSGLRAYGGGAEETEDAGRERERQRRELLGPLVPAIAQYDPDLFLSHAGSLSLMWLTAMERYVQYCDMGMEMLAIRYASWLSAPRETAEAMLDYCGCRPADMSAVYETLNRDSQADTHLSRDALEQRKRVLTEAESGDLRRHLQQHAFIHEADYEVPNTLKL